MDETKNAILMRIKNGKPASIPLPNMPVFQYQGNPLDDFIKHLSGFDGKIVKFRTREDAISWIAAQEIMEASRHKIYSTIPDVNGNITEEDISDLRNAEKIEVCITEGIMGVAEMGAIWVTDESLKHVACALLSLHLFIMIDCQQIVGGLHEAYSKLNLHDHQYGSFFTGPSATADIEAVRITGAQGPLELTAIIYNCPEVD